MSSQDSQTLILPDGRLLGYAEYGNPEGSPLLYFHGFPMSRFEAWGTDKIARHRGIRVIAPDRPGYGLSTFQPNRRITDWPADVHALVKHLNLDRVAIIGSSGGGPYALACAHALPHDMLSAVGVLSGSGPWTAGTQDLPYLAYTTYLAATYWPAGLRAMTGAVIAMVRKALATEAVKRRMDEWVEGLKTQKEEWQTPTEELTTRERTNRVVRVGLEGFAQGPEGFVHEALLLSHDWGFQLQDITYDGILVWHGTEDKNSPVRMAHYMTEHIPNSVLREFAGENHSSMFYHLEKILLELMPKDDLADRGTKI